MYCVMYCVSKKLLTESTHRNPLYTRYHCVYSEPVYTIVSGVHRMVRSVGARSGFGQVLWPGVLGGHQQEAHLAHETIKKGEI